MTSYHTYPYLRYTYLPAPAHTCTHRHTAHTSPTTHLCGHHKHKCMYTQKTGKHTHKLQPYTNALHRGVHTHSYIYQPLPQTCAETTPTMTPNTCVGTTVNAHSDTQQTSTSATCVRHRRCSHPDPCHTDAGKHFVHMHAYLEPVIYIPPPLADHTTPALQPSSCLLRLCAPCQPRSTSCPVPCYPSPGLLSCRMMARKKSWENMALVPSPSCLYPPSSQPLQSSQLGSQPGAGLQRKAHPAPFSPGQSACQARSSPAWSSPGRGQDHHGRGPPWGKEECGS